MLLIPIVLLALGCIAFTVSPTNWPLELAQLVTRTVFVIAP
jgi:hypothetical protein